MTPTVQIVRLQARVKQAAFEAIGPEAEVYHNGDYFSIAEWHTDCDPPVYIIGERKALGFLRWLGKQRRAHFRAMKAEAKKYR